MKKVNFFIFCEQTRKKRIKVLAKKIFDKNYNFLVVPIDFDSSANRYLPLEYLAKKENAELKHSLWALQSPKHLLYSIEDENYLPSNLEYLIRRKNG
mgnify:CR=1 FL=1